MAKHNDLCGINSAHNTQIIYEDTRNKVGKHDNVRKYCEAHGIELVRIALPIGDYALPDGTVAIDTKRNLSEVCTNLMTRNDSARFWREVRRAHAEGIKLYILVEHGGQIHTIRDVPLWSSQYSRVSGRRLLVEMCRVEAAYGVIWRFCSKRSTGKQIVELLNGKENKN